MKPTEFPQANRTYHRPWSMTEEECSSLEVHVSSTHNAVISRWMPSFSERVAILFGRPVWLWVIGSQPPVSLELKNPFTTRTSWWRRLTRRLRS